mgnify:CR=1 FL=1
MVESNPIVIVGSGHNGLVAANYIAQTGLEVLVLERRSFVGGACITEELFPNFRVSSCSYICHLLHNKIIEDLDLKSFGLEIYPLDPLTFSPFRDGQAILRWHDDERTAQEISLISEKDAHNYYKWLEFWKTASGVLYRYFLKDAPSYSEILSSIKGTPDELVFKRMLNGNMKDLVEEYFESDLVRAFFIDAQDAGDITAPGSIISVAYIKCNQFTDHSNLGIPKGGMGSITQSMAKAALANGVKIRINSEVTQIEASDGKVTGVTLTSGETIKSATILSNADPKRTFLNLIHPDELSNSFIENIEALKTDAAYLKFHCSMKTLPDFSNYFKGNYDTKALAYIRICPSVEYFQNSWDDAKKGLPSSSPILYIQIPTVYDNTMAPEGQHVMSVWVMYAPAKLKTGSWSSLKNEVGEHIIATISEYAPNFPDIIIDWELFTPEDLEERVYLTNGNIRHLDIVAQQMFSKRPNTLSSDYRTPIKGLYLCGAGTHPGGEVTGAPGHNAARVVLNDLAKTLP